MSTGTIVVGDDGSNCSDAAVEKALELAAGLGDTLVVVYAVEPPVLGVGDGSMPHKLSTARTSPCSSSQLRTPIDRTRGK